jgi:CRP-like cAMP-binding protein
MSCFIMLQENLNKVLVFNKLDPSLQRKVVSEMYERSVPAGEILIKEGDRGLAASELYVVKSGKFEVRGMAACQHERHASRLHTASSCWFSRQHASAVAWATVDCGHQQHHQRLDVWLLATWCWVDLQVLQRRQGVNFRVNLKERGDVFGELALMYNCARSATVAATTEAVVWVLERDVFR